MEIYGADRLLRGPEPLGLLYLRPVVDEATTVWLAPQREKPEKETLKGSGNGYKNN